MALIVVAATMLMVLALVYGLGSLVFAWWDGGIILKILIALSFLAVCYGIITYFQRHTIRL